MKHIAGTALRVTTCLVLAVTGLALLAGKDDIRKFRRMRSMADGSPGLGLPGDRRVALLPKIRLDVVALDDDAETWSRPSPSMPGPRRSATGRSG